MGFASFFNPSQHPRVTGGPGGGQFTVSVGSGSGSKAPKAKKGGGKGGGKGGKGKKGAKGGRKAPKAARGPLAFNSRTGTGTGYGKKGGDSRVRAVQTKLNKLGIRDANGKPLAVDGDLGPKTTSAIQAWQRKNGMKPTGTLDSASLPRLTGHGRTRTSTLRASSRGAGRVAGSGPGRPRKTSGSGGGRMVAAPRRRGVQAPVFGAGS